MLLDHECLNVGEPCEHSRTRSGRYFQKSLYIECGVHHEIGWKVRVVQSLQHYIPLLNEEIPEEGSPLYFSIARPI